MRAAFLRGSLLVMVAVGVTALACDSSGGTSSDTASGSGEGSETAAPSCGDQPPFPEVYASCAGAAHCGASDNNCASQTGKDPVSNQAFCTKSCFEDTDCESVGSCSATGVCIAPSGGQGVCALDCDDGRQCPDNMMCLSDLDPDTPRDLCF